MAERITRENLERRAEAVNRELSANGCAVRTVALQARNGYVGLDVYAVTDDPNDGGMVRTLTVGTKREVYDFMGGMLAFSGLLYDSRTYTESEGPRCAVCGATLTSAERDRLASDVDFVDHGDPPHLIRVVA